MPPLDVSVLSAVDKALTDVSHELSNLRTAGKSLGAAGGRLEEASGAIKAVSESVIALANRVKDVTAAISRLDPSALDSRLFELQAVLKATKDDLARATVDSWDQVQKQIAKLDSIVNAIRDRLASHAADTKTGLGDLVSSGRVLSGRLEEISERTSMGLATLTAQSKDEAELTRFAVDDAREKLEAGVRAESKRMADELSEIRNSVHDDMAKSRILLYVVLGLSVLALSASVASLFIRR